jgi:Putative prokaryotic signal transducing protein
MGQIDERHERRRLTELYADMENGELEEIAGDADSLTPMAREALRSEMLSRGMQAPSAMAAPTEASAGEQETPGPVMVGRYGGVPEAMVAKSMLDSAGIESFLGDENLVRLDWFYSNLVGGIKLMVREQDAETARSVLERNIPEKLEVTGVGEYAQPPCPKCGSLDVSFDEMNKQIAYTGFFLGVPIHVNHKGGKCQACSHEWDPEGGPNSV